MGKFIKISVLSGQDVIINKGKVVNVNRVLSDHTGAVTEYNEIRLDNGSKWNTHLSMDFLHKVLNN